jgi:YVTN family beta-propeller protein
MEFRILGPLEVVDDGRSLRLGSGRQLALLALLLVHANEAVSIDRIVDDLWADSPPPTAAKIVRNYVSLLRRELGDRLVTRSPGYLLRVESGELDSEVLERAIESGDLERLTSALELWRGPPLTELSYEPFAQDEIARLDELRLTALEARFEAQLERGQHASVIPELAALVKQHPLRERLRGLLMLALYRSGRQAQALETYQDLRSTLDKELGIAPGPAVRELERKILNQDESLAPPRPVEPAAEPRWQRRPLALVAAALVVVAVLAVAIAALAARDSGGGLGKIPPNSVGIIDLSTNEIVDVIPIGLRPGPVAGGARSVWVGNIGDRNLTRIDPDRSAATTVVSLDGLTPTGLAVGAGAVWVAHGLSGALSRVEPQFGRVTHVLEVTGRPYATPFGSVAVGANYVWAVFGDSTLARIDPVAMRESRATLAGVSSSAVAFGAGAVWVANAGDATVQRFDPNTFEQGPVATITVGKRPVAITFGEGSVWVAAEGDDAVTRIDPATDSTSTISVGDSPAAVAAGAGGVWVANADDGTLSRIDPERNAVVETIEVGSAPAGIAVVGDEIWVAAQARAT